MNISTNIQTLPVATPHQQRALNDDVIGRLEHHVVSQDLHPKSVDRKVASQEILKRIAAMTDGGRHSVRFEMDSEVNMLVVKIFDSKTDELINQIPAESLLGTVKALQEFRRGLVVDDKR